MAILITVIRATGLAIGFTMSDTSTCSLHMGGAMALLLERMETYTICLVWRWRSNTMICYLHTMSKSFTEGLVVKMFQNGTYTLIPHAHDGKYFQAALTGPQGPYSKGFLEPGKIIKQQINRRYAGH